MNDVVHVFERAGLGRAPFRFLGVERRVGPLRVIVDGGVEVSVGAPGQPMGTCDYCGEGIADCCVIRDADGRTFIVGSTCVGKTGDAGLRKVVNAAVRQQRAEQRRERDNAKIAAARQQLEDDEELRARLAAAPHPYADMASRGLTRLDWATWMLKNAGTHGRLQVVKYLKTA